MIQWSVKDIPRKPTTSPDVTDSRGRRHVWPERVLRAERTAGPRRDLAARTGPNGLAAALGRLGTLDASQNAATAPRAHIRNTASQPAIFSPIRSYGRS